MKKLKSHLLESRNLIEIKNLRVAGFDSTPVAGFQILLRSGVPLRACRPNI
jgi:hypothetical protein